MAFVKYGFRILIWLDHVFTLCLRQRSKPSLPLPQLLTISYELDQWLFPENSRNPGFMVDDDELARWPWFRRCNSTLYLMWLRLFIFLGCSCERKPLIDCKRSFSCLFRYADMHASFILCTWCEPMRNLIANRLAILCSGLVSILIIVVSWWSVVTESGCTLLLY